MLLCKQKRCLWYLVYIDLWAEKTAVRRPQPENQTRIKMSKTATIDLTPSTSLFGRLFTTIDRLLLAYAEMEIRNGDVPRAGL